MAIPSCKVTSVPISMMKNSKLSKLHSKGVLGMDKVVKAITPKGIPVYAYMEKDGTLTKEFINRKGHHIKANLCIGEKGTSLNSILEETPIGTIEQVYMKDGRVGGHIWTNEANSCGAITWSYLGNVTNPKEASVVVHKPPYKNEESVDAFKTAVDYIRGKGSLAKYTEEMAK